MFKDSHLNKPSLLRPGVDTGYYPEKEEPQRRFLDKVGHNLAGYLQFFRPRQHKYQKLLTSIHDHGLHFEKLSEEQLKGEILALRQLLHRDGLTTELTARTFGLIRESAWRTLGMRHFDCQLIGGWILVHGGLAEMETGEGKSLTATLAAGTAALAGIPVHVITVNDYLVERDASFFAPLYTFLGLQSAAVLSTMAPEARRVAYQADIAYCSNKQIAFDYLRDRLTLGGTSKRKMQLAGLHGGKAKAGQLFLRGLCFGIVDEADSVLIDEASTPLIISKGSENSLEMQNYREAFEISNQLLADKDFRVDYTNRSVSLTHGLPQHIETSLREKGGVWRNLRQAEELVRQALAARFLYLKDQHYLVESGRVVIIDENTGRKMGDRSWERGLHQLIEIKENCKVTGEKEHLARLTYQRFFRRYLCLAGMSGTLSEVRQEIWRVYGLPVQKIITNKKSLRRDGGTYFFSSRKEKLQVILNRVQEKKAAGQPVLIGTRSVADSESLSELLREYGIAHKVLNARQDHEEAEVVARAGLAGSVTIATNMAGRGTDIPLGEGVVPSGGLHVICAELNDEKRIDRQLHGRCARQGDPGSYVSFMSPGDTLLISYLGANKKGVLEKIMRLDNNLSRLLGVYVCRYAQRKMANKNRLRRAELLQIEEQYARSLAFSGPME